MAYKTDLHDAERRINMRRLFISLLVVLTGQNSVAEPTLPLGEFSRNRLDGWEHKSFKGQTRYEFQTLDGTIVLKADSQAAGSGLFKEQRIDLEKTPFLNWSWRIANRLSGLNEQSKAGQGMITPPVFMWWSRAVWHFGKPKQLIMSGPETLQRIPSGPMPLPAIMR